MFHTCDICGEEFFVPTGEPVPSMLFEGTIITVCDLDGMAMEDYDK